ncbi:Mitochondrial import inner membrane translocase subunit tim8 [Neodidymelliopsis sp. IMI 364377]|nr:Mitochondrial import inner membrane translocase subunit tim8 [Neodidymelliopsis sp. IMI 364377]
MKLLAYLTFGSLAALVAGRVIQGPSQSGTTDDLSDILQLRELQANITHIPVSIATNKENFTPEQKEAIWCKARSRGTSLIKAMMMNDAEAAAMLSWPYIESPWDGDLRAEFRKWGYSDNDEDHEVVDYECDFSNKLDLAGIFRDLQIDPRSSGIDGPNQCFYIQHENGPTVIRDKNGALPGAMDQYYNADGRKYRVTRAYAIIGINPVSGLVYFINRESAETAAVRYWGREATRDELPALRSSSDIAWGLWNRAASSNLRNLNYFVSLQVVNTETRYIIQRALQQHNIEEAPAWPGIEFQFAVEKGKELDMEAALAILGSPNGLGAGYFIIQHRRQLGWKYIWKVRVFSSEEDGWTLPNILLYVSEHATFEGPNPEQRFDDSLEQLLRAQRRKRASPEQFMGGVEPEVKHTSEDGKNVIREHVVKARLVVPSLPQPYTAINVTTLVKVVGAPAVDSNPTSGGDSPPPAKRPKLTPSSPIVPLLPGDPASPAAASPPAASPQSEWEKYVCRGARLTLACKNDKIKAEQFVSPASTPWDGTLENEFKLWGYTEDPYADCDFEGEYYNINRALEALNVFHGEDQEQDDDGDSPNHCFRIFHYDPEKVVKDGKDVAVADQTYKVDNKEYRVTGAHGTFGINADEGVIWFIDRSSASLKAASLWKVNDPPADQLPALRQMSDISWGFWNRVHTGSNLGHITKFIIPQVITESTRRLIDQALKTYIVPQGQQRLTDVPTWPGITFSVETEQGQALLGSSNGIATAYFLLQHKTQIGGNKYVYQVTVFQPDSEDENEPSLVYYVKDAPAPSPEDKKDPEKPNPEGSLAVRDLDLSVNKSLPGSSSASTQSSTVNLVLPAVAAEPTPGPLPSADESFWQRYVCRGEKLTQASRNNKDKAVQFASPIDSEWDGTLEKKLKLWGYRDKKEQPFTCDLSIVAPNLAKLGIDAKFKDKGGQNECFAVYHLRVEQDKQGKSVPVADQKYTVGEKSYRMTDAHSVMAVNARDGVLTFLDVKSAEKGASRVWGVAKPSVDELPKLRQISDLAWGFWNRAHPGGANLDKINKFLVHDIANEDTLKLIKIALKTYKVPEGQSRYKYLPKWPGLVFYIETDEGKAMFGSPNGLAAGYFLAQHKTQLGGNKYVYQVTVWRDSDGDEQMMLWVKDAPPPEEEEPDKTKKLQGGVLAGGKKVRHSKDGKKMMRKHIVRAKL